MALFGIVMLCNDVQYSKAFFSIVSTFFPITTSSNALRFLHKYSVTFVKPSPKTTLFNFAHPSNIESCSFSNPLLLVIVVTEFGITISVIAVSANAR